eukprot:UN34485
MTTASHIRLPKTIREEEAQQKQLEQVVEKYHTDYQTMVSKQKKYETELETRIKEFNVLLKKAQSSTKDQYGMKWYPLDQQQQIKFESFLFDTRMREGRYIKGWLERQTQIKNNKKNKEMSTLQQIQTFLERLTNTICDSYKVPINNDQEDGERSSDWDIVRLLVHRAMMSRMYYLVDERRSIEDKENDEKLVRKFLWMRVLKQEQ